MPSGKSDLTIKSSKIDEYPRGYRITRNHPALAKIIGLNGSTPVVIGDGFQFGVPEVGSNSIAFGTPHGFQVGDRVTLSSSLFSPYYCASENMAPFGAAQCPADRVGFFMIRGYSMLQNGNVVYARGPKLPSPLQSDKPYYVVQFSEGSNSPEGPDRFKLSETPDGEPIVLGSDFVYNSGLILEFPAAPARYADVFYVASVQNPTDDYSVAGDWRSGSRPLAAEVKGLQRNGNFQRGAGGQGECRP